MQPRQPAVRVARGRVAARRLVFHLRQRRDGDARALQQHVNRRHRADVQVVGEHALNERTAGRQRRLPLTHFQLLLLVRPAANVGGAAAGGAARRSLTRASREEVRRVLVPRPVCELCVDQAAKDVVAKRRRLVPLDALVEGATQRRKRGAQVLEPEIADFIADGPIRILHPAVAAHLRHRRLHRLRSFEVCSHIETRRPHLGWRGADRLGKRLHVGQRRVRHEQHRAVAEPPHRRRRHERQRAEPDAVRETRAVDHVHRTIVLRGVQPRTRRQITGEDLLRPNLATVTTLAFVGAGHLCGDEFHRADERGFQVFGGQPFHVINQTSKIRAGLAGLPTCDATPQRAPKLRRCLCECALHVKRADAIGADGADFGAVDTGSVPVAECVDRTFHRAHVGKRAHCRAHCHERRGIAENWCAVDDEEGTALVLHGAQARLDHVCVAIVWVVRQVIGGNRAAVFDVDRRMSRQVAQRRREPEAIHLLALRLPIQSVVPVVELRDCKRRKRQALGYGARRWEIRHPFMQSPDVFQLRQIEAFRVLGNRHLVHAAAATEFVGAVAQRRKLRHRKQPLCPPLGLPQHLPRRRLEVHHIRRRDREPIRPVQPCYERFVDRRPGLC